MSPWGFRSEDGSLSLIDPEPAVLKISSPDALLQAAVSGLGIAQVGVRLAYPFLEKGRLNTVLWGQYDPGNYEMVLQYPHRSFIAPRVKATIDYLLKHFENDETLHIPLNKLSGYEYKGQ